MMKYWLSTTSSIAAVISFLIVRVLGLEVEQRNVDGSGGGAKCWAWSRVRPFVRKLAETIAPNAVGLCGATEACRR